MEKGLLENGTDASVFIEHITGAEQPGDSSAHYPSWLAAPKNLI